MVNQAQEDARPPVPPPVPIEFGATGFHRVDTSCIRVTGLSFAPGTILPLHRHELPTVALVLEGSVRTKIGARWVESTPGSLWTEPAGEIHLNIAGPGGFRVVALQPDLSIPDLFDPLRTTLERVHEARHPGLFRAAGRLDLEIRDGAEAGSLVENMALTILARVARVTRSGSDASPAPPWLARVRELLHDRFREPIGLQQAALEAGVHPSHLARAFKRRFGTTLGEYGRRLRVEWAARLLVDTGTPLGEIARLAGFCDASHFSVCFKRHYGCSPAGYRNRCLAAKSSADRVRESDESNRDSP